MSSVRSRVALALALVGCTALAVAVPLAQRARERADFWALAAEENRRETLETLEGLATLLDEARTEGLAPPETRGLRNDQSGLDELVGGLRRARVEHPTSGIEWVHADRYVSGNHVSRFVEYRDFDAWGRAIRYRCPGVVHKNGWDLYSLGPNGVDEAGEGDDLVVGANVAVETSATGSLSSPLSESAKSQVEPSDDGEDSLEPVARVGRRSPEGSLAIAIGAVVGVLLVVASGVRHAREIARVRKDQHARLSDVRDFLGATIGEGFEAPATGPEGIALPEVVAAIQSWGLAPVSWSDDQILVSMGRDSFVLPATDARGQPFRFRHPAESHVWEVFAGSDALGGEIAPVESDR